MNALDDYRSEIEECQRCRLGASRTNFVFGTGAGDADLMFVGEAPGKQEDLTGHPFMGAAGRLLDELLGDIGLKRSEVFIANVLKCRPPGNRDPKPDEIDQCRPYVEEQIRMIAPKVVCTLGNFSTRLLLDRNEGITQLRGELFDHLSYKVVPLFHPAAALYAPALKEALVDDFGLLGATLGAD